MRNFVARFAAGEPGMHGTGLRLLRRKNPEFAALIPGDEKSRAARAGNTRLFRCFVARFRAAKPGMGGPGFPARLRRTGLLLVALLLPAAGAFAADRIVSLGGDITEIVYRLGAQQALVAVDTTSVWPVEAQALPNVGYVRQLGAEGVLALRPTLVLATHDAGPPAVLEQLRGAGVRIERFEATRTAADIAAKVRRLGVLLDRREPAETLALDIEAQANDLAATVAAMPAHPRTVFLLSGASGGLMVSGRNTAADAAVKLAGGHNVVDGYEGYKPLSPEALVLLRPEVLLLMSNARGDDRVGVEDVLKLPGVAQTPAGRARRVLLVDGQGLLGFGPRTVEQAVALQRELRAGAAP